MSKKTQERYRLAGLCVLCGKQAPREGKQTCDGCAERTAINTKTSRARRISNGKCCVCGENELVTKRHCQSCYDKHKESAKKNYEILRDQVFSAYGGYICACCRETEKAFLTIDHINNDGCKHRKEIGQSNVYRWLKQNNFPDGFQVLCMNCQWGRKNCGGICPHQHKEQSYEDR